MLSSQMSQQRFFGSNRGVTTRPQHWANDGVITRINLVHQTAIGMFRQMSAKVYSHNDSKKPLYNGGMHLEKLWLYILVDICVERTQRGVVLHKQKDSDYV
jgi:transposase